MILIFSIAIGADYSFDIKSGFSIAPVFSMHKNFDTASVHRLSKFEVSVVVKLKHIFELFGLYITCFFI